MSKILEARQKRVKRLLGVADDSPGFGADALTAIEILVGEMNRNVANNPNLGRMDVVLGGGCPPTGPRGVGHP